jgi:hypothetical protein
MGETEKAPERASSGKKPEAVPITFAEFLESTGSSQPMQVTGLWERTSAGPARLQTMLLTPQLLLHCTNDICNGPRIFRYFDGGKDFGEAQTLSAFVTYRCANCIRTTKVFALHARRAENGDGTAYKFGEFPRVGPQTPTPLLRLFGKDRDLFLQGRQCEVHGLGIGSFVYYRRVVENHKNQIMDEIIKVAQKVGASAEMIQALETAKEEIQFSKGVEAVKVAIPQALLVDGHNPLTLLHSALSADVHELTDQQCLQRAHDVRLVLADLAERITQALTDQAELKAAVSRLLKVTDPAPVIGAEPYKLISLDAPATYPPAA